MTLADTPAVNIAHLRDWHLTHHHATTWATCPYPPCSVTTPTFRQAWDNK